MNAADASGQQPQQSRNRVDLPQIRELGEVAAEHACHVVGEEAMPTLRRLRTCLREAALDRPLHECVATERRA